VEIATPKQAAAAARCLTVHALTIFLKSSYSSDCRGQEGEKIIRFLVFFLIFSLPLSLSTLLLFLSPSRLERAVMAVGRLAG
jgi:hypothetical protein